MSFLHYLNIEWCFYLFILFSNSFLNMEPGSSLGGWLKTSSVRLSGFAPSQIRVFPHWNLLLLTEYKLCVSCVLLPRYFADSVHQLLEPPSHESNPCIKDGRNYALKMI